MDHWLLGADLSHYSEPWAFNRLNVVEKILLARAKLPLAQMLWSASYKTVRICCLLTLTVSNISLIRP